MLLASAKSLSNHSRYNMSLATSDSKVLSSILSWLHGKSEMHVRYFSRVDVLQVALMLTAWGSMEIAEKPGVQLMSVSVLKAIGIVGPVTSKPMIGPLLSRSNSAMAIL